MIAGSKSRKRFIAGAVGVVYALLYGFWTLLLTGGGHVNFVWFYLFMSVEFFGLYFPLMAVLTVDLRGRLLKVIYGGLIGFNIIASAVIIGDWAAAGPSDRPSDFERTVNINGYGGFLMDLVIHFLPAFVFSILLLRAIKNSGPVEDRDRVTEVKLY